MCVCSEDNGELTLLSENGMGRTETGGTASTFSPVDMFLGCYVTSFTYYNFIIHTFPYIYSCSLSPLLRQTKSYVVTSFPTEHLELSRER